MQEVVVLTKDCNPCDINNESTFERNIVVSKPTFVNQGGEFTLDAVDSLFENFSQSIVAEAETGALADFVNRYGFDRINQIRGTVNSLINDSDLQGYDAIVERYNLPESITNLEVCQFMRDNLYNPDSLQNQCQSNSPKVLNELNSFFNGSWAASLLGGLCGSVNNVFGAAGALFNMIGKVGDVLAAAMQAISSIENLLDEAAAAFEKIKVAALIESIKKKVVEAIEKEIEKVSSAIDNFSLSGIFGDTSKKIGGTPKQLQEKIAKEKAKAKALITGENKKTLLEKIEGMINYAIDKFINPSLQAIELLVTRMCGFTVSFEEMLNNLLNPLKKITEDAQETEKTIKNNSLASLSDSLFNGAIRFDDKTTLEGINRMEEKCREESTRRATESANNGTGPSKRTAKKLTDADIDGIPTFEQIIQPGGAKGIYLDPNHRYVKHKTHGSRVWDTKVTAEHKAALLRLINMFGVTPVRLTNAWRSEEYNKMLRRESKKVAKYSRHLQGDAFDLMWNGLTDNLEEMFEFAWLARALGFGGIGLYPNRYSSRGKKLDDFIHVDFGPERCWPRERKKQFNDWCTRNNDRLNEKYGLGPDDKKEKPGGNEQPEEQEETTTEPSTPVANYSQSGEFVIGYDVGPNYENLPEHDLIVATDLAESGAIPEGVVHKVTHVFQGAVQRTSIWKTYKSKLTDRVVYVNISDPDSVARFKKIRGYEHVGT